MKPPNFEEGDGTPVDVKEVQQKMIESWGDANALDIKKSEFHYQEKTVRISTLRPQLVLQKGTTVSSFTDTQTSRLYNLIIQSNEILDNSQSKLSTREKSLEIAKSALYDQTTALAMHKSAMKVIQNSTLATSNSELNAMADESEITQTGIELYINLMYVCGYTNFQCYNLTIENTKEAAPDLVRQQTNCLGLPNCQINVTKIQFDVVFTSYDETAHTTVKSKVIYKIKLSPDVPYLSHLMDFCYMGMASSNNQKFPVEICYQTENFKKGN